MKRTARPITAKYLQNAAAFYLERYPSTAEGLRRVLNRRVRKAEMLEAPVMDNVKQAIEAVVAKFVDAGVIDDKAFAQTKARALHRRGTSTRLTRRKLQIAGVDGDTLDQAMVGLDQELDTNPGQREWRAAAALARRRRLGPYRPPEDRKDNRDARPGGDGPRRLRLRRCQKGDRCAQPRCTGRGVMVLIISDVATPVTWGSAPRRARRGKAVLTIPRISDPKSSSALIAAFPLRPCGPPPRMTGEA